MNEIIAIVTMFNKSLFFCHNLIIMRFFLFFFSFIQLIYCRLIFSKYKNYKCFDFVQFFLKIENLNFVLLFSSKSSQINFFSYRFEKILTIRLKINDQIFLNNHNDFFVYFIIFLLYCLIATLMIISCLIIQKRFKITK